MKKCFLILPFYLSFFFTGFLFITPLLLHAESAPPVVSYSVERVSDAYPSEYIVRFRADDGSRILGMDLTNADFSKVSLVLSREPSKDAGEYAVRVKSFELSNFIVPALQAMASSGNRTDTFLTPEIEVTQNPKPFSVSNMAPVEEIFSIGDPVFWIILVLVLLALGTAGFLAYRLLLNKKTSLPLKPIVRTDPYEEALKNLNRLKQMKMNSKNYKDIYLGIWETVRRFTGRVFEFQALEMSTSEIADHFNRSSAEGASGEALGEIHDIGVHLLKYCDRVKYARFQPPAEQTDVILNDSFELVRKCREYFDGLRTAEEEKNRQENPS